MQRRAMRDAIISQCLASLSTLAISYGIVLLYLKALGFSDDRIFLYLSIGSIGDAVVRIPCAFLGDRFGKKKIGLAGATLEFIGVSLIAIGPFFGEETMHFLLYAGIVAQAFGTSCFGAPWFALLSPIVPESMRGRFFGRLRFTWQFVGIIFYLLCTPLLHDDTRHELYQLVLAVCAAGLGARIYFFVRLPELENTRLAPIRFS